MTASLRVPALVVAAVLLAAGCGGGTAGDAAAVPSASTTPGGGAAFADCLRAHGVAPPTGRPGGASTPRPDASPFARPSGGPGGPGAMNPQWRAAFEACRSLAPRGGRGPGRPDDSALRAFRSCMKDNGADLAEGEGRRRLDTGDPAVARALEKCRPLMPTPVRPGAGASSPT
ncbi:hypothetical protein Sru01_45560 [Sphaerisporangium rufum]|uniref:Uncharacterized protein n=1 Tax=Sphaerisporangium rufum TaxID=1381558 RepID=A0A919V1B8_9ACTN|nr:hypothetical protein [Sphaerisporangium rufum]GII79574.1 hypothetical protein Sru01_45560 [Sphaerisporangium rufum]